MIRFWLILVYLVCASVNDGEFPRPAFAVKISPQADGKDVHLMCFINNGRGYALPRNLSPQEFIRFASGEWPSPYNRKRENLIEKNGLECAVLTDSLTLKEYVWFPALDSLWKIRYEQYPFSGKDNEFGWSEERFKPSAAQMRYLKERYNVSNIEFDYFIDSSFWKILNDVTDPEWIGSYKSIE